MGSRVSHECGAAIAAARLKVNGQCIKGSASWLSSSGPGLPPTRPSMISAARRADGSGLARHPLLTFTVLTLVLSWLPIIPYALGLFPAPLLACGPFLAAIITAAMVGGGRDCAPISAA